MKKKRTYPKKYNETTFKLLFDSLESGNGRIISAKKAGISYQTFLDWIELHPEFVERLKNAETKGTTRRDELATAAILQAMEKDWHAGAWWLERTHQDVYALKYKMEHSGPGGKILETRNSIDLSPIADKVLLTLIAMGNEPSKP